MAETGRLDLAGIVRADGTDLPPVVVYSDGQPAGPAVGWHRCAAYERAGRADARPALSPPLPRDLPSGRPWALPGGIVAHGGR